MHVCMYVYVYLQRMKDKDRSLIIMIPLGKVNIAFDLRQFLSSTYHVCIYIRRIHLSLRSLFAESFIFFFFPLFSLFLFLLFLSHINRKSIHFDRTFYPVNRWRYIKFIHPSMLHFSTLEIRELGNITMIARTIDKKHNEVNVKLHSLSLSLVRVKTLFTILWNRTKKRDRQNKRIRERE